MSNTPNQDPNTNQAPSENYGSAPLQPPAYPSQEQGNYRTPSNYPSQGQGSYGPPSNYPPQGQGNYAMPPNYQPQEAGNYGTPPPNYPPQGNYGMPPPNYQPNVPAGYGAPYPPNVPPNYGYNPPPASSPLPLGDAVRQLPSQYLRVLTKPGATTFAMEKGKAAWNIIWVQIAALAVFSFLIGFAIVNITLAATLNSQNLPSTTANAFRGIFGFLPFSYIIFVPVGIFIGTGIYHLIAKAFGGDGNFVEYLYSYLLYYVPIAIISLIIGLIPFIGSLAASALGIYGIVLQIFMTMAVHRLSGGRATIAVLLLPIILIVLSIIGAIVLVAVIAAALQHR